jgi:hypothetical protein
MPLKNAAEDFLKKLLMSLLPYAQNTRLTISRLPHKGTGLTKTVGWIFQPFLTIKARADGETPGVRDVRYYYGSHTCINDGNRAGKIFRIHHYFFPIKLIFID